jgi:hypothetical protein
VDTWLIVAVVVAVVVIALLAVLARRRGRSQRPPAPPGRAPELGAVGEPPVSAEPDPIGRGGGVDAPDSAEAPTSPVGAPTLAGSSNPAPADQTMRLPVRGPRPDPVGQVDPTDVLPVVRRPRRDPSLPDGAEPNRHARPDGQPPPEPPNGGGGRHRADAEQSGPWEPNRSADVQRTEPRGAAVVPNPAGAEPPLPPPPAGAEPPLPRPPAGAEPPPPRPPGAEPPPPPPPAGAHGDAGPLPVRRRPGNPPAFAPEPFSAPPPGFAGGPPLSPHPLPAQRAPEPTGAELFTEATAAIPATTNGDHDDLADDDGRRGPGRNLAARLLGRKR